MPAVQIHVMKVRGDRNVPAGQCTLIADLANWTWGPLDWQEFTLPICALPLAPPRLPTAACAPARLRTYASTREAQRLQSCPPL